MIIVTGGSGFIGSCMVWKLNKEGYKDILIVEEKSRKDTCSINNLKNKKIIDYINNKKFLKNLIKKGYNNKVEAVFHLGACSDTTETDKKYLRENNTEYSKKIANWCLKNNIYFLYASSAAVYGNGENGFDDNDGKNHLHTPLNLYGKSKLDFDIWAIKNKISDKIVGLRFFNVYGPNENHKGHMKSMVQIGYEQIKKTGKIKLFKSYHKKYKHGESVRDFVYVKDVVNIMFWLFKNQQIKGIFNIGTGKATSWNNLAKAIFKAMKLKPKIEYVEMPESLRKQYQYFTKAKTSKIKKKGLPVRFKDIFEGVRDYVQNHLELNTFL